MIKIKKNDVEYNVMGDYCKNWFQYSIREKWEEETFNILDFYSKTKPVYIDIGAWIGPTVLYASRKYDNIICFEPDPVAVERLEQNILISAISNVTLVKKALSESEGTTKFGGNWELGNSMSTLLVNNEQFLNSGNIPGQYGDTNSRSQNIIEVATTTLEKVLDDNKIIPDDIALIKMDIEGGESIVIPAIQSFLEKHKPPLYISLHRCFLLPPEITKLVDILFNIYPHCYIFSPVNSSERIEVTKSFVQRFGLLSLVFSQ